MKRFILRLIFLCICFCGSLGVNAAQKWTAYATSYKKGNADWSKSISCNIPIIICIFIRKLSITINESTKFICSESVWLSTICKCI